MQTDSGCKGCIDRHEGCHSTCEKYRLWKKKQEDEKAVIRDKREKEMAIAIDIKARIGTKRKYKWH